MSSPTASRFPYEVAGGVYVFIGGRSDAESAEFLLNNNVRVVICATGIHNNFCAYPLEIAADRRRFQHFKFAIGFESPRRERCDVNEPCHRAHTSLVTLS
eukprot:NODE_4182_length_702_cov_1.366306.p1 GENE.NODE_4182_length_702_cov_1.366306~~NODE_4182_length_702_cov_1.366306.p1  ORF type:complete len:100 (-),score=10.89 NODE_4182_length_702_cov_1.366306:279-578(-)